MTKLNSFRLNEQIDASKEIKESSEKAKEYDLMFHTIFSLQIHISLILKYNICAAMLYPNYVTKPLI